NATDPPPAPISRQRAPGPAPRRTRCSRVPGSSADSSPASRMRSISQSWSYSYAFLMTQGYARQMAGRRHSGRSGASLFPVTPVLSTGQRSPPRGLEGAMKKKVPPVGAEGLKPISGKELDELSAKAGVTSLSTQDVRRLLADYRRLRQIVLDAYPYV